MHRCMPTRCVRILFRNLQLQIRDVPPGEAGSTSYSIMALIRPLNDFAALEVEPGAARAFPEEFFLVDSAGAVRAGTLGALVLLSIAPDELLANTVLLSDVFLGWSVAVTDANSAGGVVVNLQVQYMRSMPLSCVTVIDHTSFRLCAVPSRIFLKTRFSRTMLLSRSPCLTQKF